MRNMDFFDEYQYRKDLNDDIDDIDSVHGESERDYTASQTSRRYNYANTIKRQRNYERQSNVYVDMRRKTPRRYPQDDRIDNANMSRRDRRRMRNIDRLYGDTEYNRYNDGRVMSHSRRRDRYAETYNDRRYRDNRYHDRYRDNSRYSRAPFIKGNHGQVQRNKNPHMQFQKPNMNTAIKLLGLILLVLMIIFAVKGESAYSGVTGVIVVLYIGNFLTSKGKRSNKGQ